MKMYISVFQCCKSILLSIVQRNIEKWKCNTCWKRNTCSLFSQRWNVFFRRTPAQTAFFPHEDVTGGISTICFLPHMRAICMTRHLRLLGKNQKRITRWEKARELGLIVIRWAYQVLSNLRIFFFNLSPFCSHGGSMRVPLVSLSQWGWETIPLLSSHFPIIDCIFLWTSCSV